MKSAPTKVVYTAVFGNYDHVLAVNPEWGCDFVCFTDNPELISHGWKVVIVQLNGEPPAQANRRYKILPHKYLPDYEHSLYIDGNIRLVSDPIPLFLKYLENGSIAIPRHQDRDCVYEEARVCIEYGLVKKNITNQQMARYKADGFPKKIKMTENNIIFRKHHDPDIVSLMTAWWDEYCQGGRRDQLSLPYLLWKNKIYAREVVEGPRICQDYFKINLHHKDTSKSLLNRLELMAHAKKHLHFYYLFISKVISSLIIIRDKCLFTGFFRESKLAHQYCKGKGIEIGGSAHNPFGLDTLNIDYSDSMETCFKKYEIRKCGKSLPIDIVAAGDYLPLADESQDFVVSSHVFEHLANPIKALLEWDRVVKPMGIIFMIIPHKKRTFDKKREPTPLAHLINDFHSDTSGPTNDEEHRHHHVWITEDIVELINHMIIEHQMAWELLRVEDRDDKVGNGFTIIIKKLKCKA